MLITIKEIKNIFDDTQLDNCFKAREEELNTIMANKEKEVNYDDILLAIDNIPNCFTEVKANIINKIELYLEQERQTQSEDIEKSYKVGFCDAIQLIIQTLK